jgi:hypothetical protein
VPFSGCTLIGVHAKSSGGVRRGIDPGGTFTDFAALDESTGELILAKYPSSSRYPVGMIVGVIKIRNLPPTGFRRLCRRQTACLLRSGLLAIVAGFGGCTEGLGNAGNVTAAEVRKFRGESRWKR